MESTSTAFQPCLLSLDKSRGFSSFTCCQKISFKRCQYPSLVSSIAFRGSIVRRQNMPATGATATASAASTTDADLSQATLTCTKCLATFDSSETKRTHMRGDWQ